MSLDPSALAHELLTAYASGTPIAAPPSARDPGFDLATAYRVEADLVRLRRAAGATPAGLKVGFANKAMWRILKLDTLVWAHLYSDTVHHATRGEATLALGHRCSPRIEPEIVVRLKAPLPAGTADAAAVLAAVDWIALGFEVNDCLFPNWTFTPADFVAAFGLHTALIVGTPLPVTPANIPTLADALARFTLRLSRDGELVEEGAGRNALKNPALCVAELASAVARQAEASAPAATSLGVGDIISTGTLTAAHPIAPGQAWRVDTNGIDGLDVEGLTLSLLQ